MNGKAVYLTPDEEATLLNELNDNNIWLQMSLLTRST